MTSPPGRKMGTSLPSEVIFEAPNTPQPFEDFSNVHLSPVRRDISSDSIGSHRQFSINLPSLPYSKSTSANYASTQREIGTEYNPPTKGNGGGNRLRGHYMSLDHAIADDSRPDFNPEHLYATERNTSNYVSNDKSPEFSPEPGREKGLYTSGYGFYPPTPDYGTRDAETDFLKTPSPSLFPRGLPKPPKRHPFCQSYEVPKWKAVARHTLFCLLAYPFLLIFVIIARGRTLFWTRLVVGIGCGLVGVLLGWSLLALARRHLEAAAWATVMHQSKFHEHPGVRLRDIAPHAEDPVSAYNGLRLLWNRQMYPGAARKNRAHYDIRPWSIHIIFFLILFALSGSLPFILGRIVVIDTQVENQRERYYEAAIKGDASDADIQSASKMLEAFNDFRITWTLAPYSSHGGLPPVVGFPWNDPSNTSHSDSVYFAETTKSQLRPDGSGFGTFDSEVLTPPLDTHNSSTSMSTLQTGLLPGNIIRQPQWGLRIKCEKIPDAQNNILPISRILSRTYVFLPKTTVGGLLGYYGKPFPTTDFPSPPTLASGDQDWPSNVNQSDTLYAVEFFNNGVNHAYWSRPLYQMGQDGTGFASLEVVLIRLNTTFAAQGQFPVYGDVVPDNNGTATRIGYDAAVCAEVFEPWIVEVYNSTVGSPTSQRIVEKGNVVRDFNTGHTKERMSGRAISDQNVKRELTSKRIQSVYEVAHQNSVNELIKDNGRDSFYVPSTVALSYTTGQGAYGYTSLSATLFEKARALADASNLLPYFAGSGSIVARVYPDRVAAYAFIEPVPIAAALVAVFVLGVTAALFVPRLPMGVPRRGFELYSWVAAFYADELVGVGKARGRDGAGVAQAGAGPVGLPIGRRMEIEDIEEHIGDVRFRYAS